MGRSRFSGQRGLSKLDTQITGRCNEKGMCQGITMSFSMSSLKGFWDDILLTSVIKDSFKDPAKVTKSHDKKRIVTMISDYQGSDPDLSQEEIIGPVTIKFMGYEFAEQVAIMRPGHNGIGEAEEKGEMRGWAANLLVLLQDYVLARTKNTNLPEKIIFKFVIRRQDFAAASKESYHTVAIQYDANSIGNEWAFMEPNSLAHYDSTSSHGPYFCGAKGNEKSFVDEVVDCLAEFYSIHFEKVEEPEVAMSVESAIFMADPENPITTFDSVYNFFGGLDFRPQKICPSKTKDETTVDANYWTGEICNPEPAILIEQELTPEMAENAFKIWRAEAAELSAEWDALRDKAVSWIRFLKWMEAERGHKEYHDISEKWCKHYIKLCKRKGYEYGYDKDIQGPESRIMEACHQNDTIFEEKQIDELSDKSAKALDQFICEIKLAIDNSDLQKLETLYQLIQQNILMLKQINREDLQPSWKNLADEILNQGRAIQANLLQARQNAESASRLEECKRIVDDAVQQQDLATLEMIYNNVQQFICILKENHREDLTSDWINLVKEIERQAVVIQSNLRQPQQWVDSDVEMQDVTVSNDVTPVQDMEMEVDGPEEQLSTQVWCSMYSPSPAQNDPMFSNIEECGIPSELDPAWRLFS